MVQGKNILLATTNKGKAAEFQSLLADLGVKVVTLADYPDIGEIAEDGQTFAENALIKARAAAKVTGLPAAADDSGLMVDALGGRPGIYSARFAGEPCDDQRNIDKLLALLADVPAEARGARFCCALALVYPDGREYVIEGRCLGRIVDTMAGEGGFGYDPIFYTAIYGRTFAQLTMAEKNAISHRGQAFQEAKTLIKTTIGGIKDANCGSK